MCRRTSKDPLLRQFLQTYGLNLLQVPREDASVGDLYAVRGERVLPPGRIEEFVVPAPRLPRVRNEPIAHLAGIVSDDLSVEAGIGLLEPFLAALGAGVLASEIRARYHAATVRRLRFRIEDARREYIHTTSLARALASCSVPPDHPMAGGDYRHYVAVGVVRTSSITVRTEGAVESNAKLGASSTFVGRAGGSVAIEHAGENEVRYRGSTPLAIGVELVELAFGDGGVRFKPQARPVRARGAGDRAFIGPADGDAFLEVG